MKLSLAVLLALSLAPAAERHSFEIKSSSVQWTPAEIPGVPAGMMQRVLHNDQVHHTVSAVVKIPKGYREPRHYHTTCGHSMYILHGKLTSPDGELTSGMFAYAAVNERHGPYTAAEETLVLFYTDGPFDYIIEDK